jgi:hypothetical protein
MTTAIWTGEVNRGAPFDALGRLCVFAAGTRTASPVATEGFLIKQADVTSISVRGWIGRIQVGSTQTPTVSNVIYDTLQTTGAWATVTGGGGNAYYQIPASLMDVSTDHVRVQIELTMTDSTKMEWLWDITVNQAAT